jgi:hypothetical protein
LITHEAKQSHHIYTLAIRACDVAGSASKVDTLTLPATSPLTAEQLDVISDHNSLPWQQPVAAAAVERTDRLSDTDAASHDNVFVVGKGKHS